MAQVMWRGVIVIWMLLVSSQAFAFCGFYASGVGTKGALYNRATQVVLLRHGTTTVLSMRNTYEGPPEDFAMVVPVPVILKKDQVKTLEDKIFQKIDMLAAPRLVNYWERDPCEYMKYKNLGDKQFGSMRASFKGSGGMAFGSAGVPKTVRVRATFTKGEYDIVLLSATNSNDLETWLKTNKYKIPAGASKVLKPYIQQGMYFFVAKVNIKRVKTFTIQGKPRPILSPLRFHYDSPQFSLPVRLGLLNSNGKQELLIHILAKSRYEVANAPNVTIPTNLVVSKKVSKQFPSFYNQLFDDTHKQNPKAVVTEYAWESSKCDPCPSGMVNGTFVGGALRPNDLMTLGLDTTLSKKLSWTGMKMLGKMRVTRGAGTPHRRIRETLIKRAESCTYMVSQKDGLNVIGVSLTFKPTSHINQVSMVRRVGKSTKLKRCLMKRMRYLNTQYSKMWGLTKPMTVSFNLAVQVIDAHRNGTTGWVLTRLHARYDEKTLKSDLVFRVASPIVGGRGTPIGKYGRMKERGARRSKFNQFQGRYMILNRWAGKIKCQRPKRWDWSGSGHGSRTTTARNLAFSPRAGLQLSKVIWSKRAPGLSWDRRRRSK